MSLKQALKSALKLCEWIAETPHQSGSINGLAAQVEHAARAALAEEAMQCLTVDPVAYVNDEGWFRSAEDADAAFRATAQPLYAAPPKREPLTDAEIQDVLRNTFVDDTVQTDDMVLIRAIERAHGIGGEK